MSEEFSNSVKRNLKQALTPFEERIHNAASSDHQLKDLPQQHVNMHSYRNEIRNLIRAGESSSLEFKSTMRTNLKNEKPGKEIELAWLKAVVGFMNSDGGILLIGVSDDGEILGLDADNFANEDKCRLHFKNLINTHIGVEFTRFISLFVNIEKKASCLSSVNVYDDRFSSALGKTKTFSFVPAHQTQNCQ
jgi:hypothetical protein